MRIVHIGPRLSRTGGPAGYLYELAAAAQGRGWHKHEVVLPPAADAQPQPTSVGLLSRARQQLRRVKQHVVGPPRLYRPSAADLIADRGLVHANMLRTQADAIREAHDSIERGLAAPADVLFTHDMFCAEHLLERRHPHQRVWLLLHSPMPLALYLAWSWGNPEHDWREILSLPDVRTWVTRELDVCARVDRILLPCSDAADDLARADARFADVLARADSLLTGAAGPASRQPAAADRLRQRQRRRWRLPSDQRVGLFLGNAQPYRGLDVLIAALDLLPRNGAAGAIAVAGPAVEALPFHRRLRALGRVDDVASLLGAVDFVINVNRFSLFDLSTIEATEAGKPLLLHAVGGNKTFRALGAGCVMLNALDPSAVAAGLQAMFAMDAGQLRRLGQASRTCYEAHLTPRHLWERHLQLYDAASSDARCVSIA
jgi:glycosyltransferase involved in cell wall biosynthesis